MINKIANENLNHILNTIVIQDLIFSENSDERSIIYFLWNGLEYRINLQSKYVERSQYGLLYSDNLAHNLSKTLGWK